jgi:hypothetical protein
VIAFEMVFLVVLSLLCFCCAFLFVGEAVSKKKKVHGGEIEVTITALSEILYIGQKARLQIVCYGSDSMEV